MNLSEMTKAELIELVQQLQFSLNETQKVVQQLVKELPANRTAYDKENRDGQLNREQLSLKQQLKKHDLFKMYENIVAADIFNGVDDTTAKQNAISTITEVLAIEGVSICKDSLYKYFPANKELNVNPE